MYDKIAKLIVESDVVSFNPFGQGVKELWIQKAEAHLGLRLPPSYKWWLKNFGGGEIGEEEIYSIYEIDFETAVGGDIVSIAISNKKIGFCGKERLYISRTGFGERFYFDTTKSDESGEFKIYIEQDKDRSTAAYADNFIEYLQKRIEFHERLQS